MACLSFIRTSAGGASIWSGISAFPHRGSSLPFSGSIGTTWPTDERPCGSVSARVLRDIAPHVTCDALIDYWFANDAHLNEVLLAELASIRAGGIEVHLATVQE